MFSSLIITKDPIAPKETAVEGEIGAMVRFFGIVRPTEGKETIQGIDYEAFHEMAEHQFERIFEEANQKWPIDSISVIHRIGLVPAGEPSLYLEVTSGHRGEAFAAAQYIIDEMKMRVPIWKRPVTSKPSKS